MDLSRQSGAHARSRWRARNVSGRKSILDLTTTLELKTKIQVGLFFLSHAGPPLISVVHTPRRRSNPLPCYRPQSRPHSNSYMYVLQCIVRRPTTIQTRKVAVPASLPAAGGLRVGVATRPVLALQGAAPLDGEQETLAIASAWLSSVAPLPGVAASATGACLPARTERRAAAMRDASIASCSSCATAWPFRRGACAGRGRWRQTASRRTGVRATVVAHDWAACLVVAPRGGAFVVQSHAQLVSKALSYLTH